MSEEEALQKMWIKVKGNFIPYPVEILKSSGRDTSLLLTENE